MSKGTWLILGAVAVAWYLYTKQQAAQQQAAANSYLGISSFLSGIF